MHMAPDAALPDILEPGASPAETLLRRLAPERWPLPIEALPAGTALVGGAVRDALLHRLNERPDLDLVVPSDALNLCRTLAASCGGSSVVLDAERDMARLVLNGWTIDFARQEGQSLDDDLRRRDYTINAIALPLGPHGALVDPTGGVNDLQNRRLRAVCESNLTNDPLRLLRGVRLMAELPLELDPQTITWIQCHRERLQDAAPERILAEVQRLVAAPRTDLALSALMQLQLLAPWQDAAMVASVPPGEQEALAMNQEERQRWLPLSRITQLITDDGLKRLRASRQLRQRCRRLRRWLNRLPEDPGALKEADRYELHLELEDDLPALIVHLPEHLQQDWLQRWRDADDPLFHPSPPLDGSELQRELGLAPGPVIGRLLDHLRRERAFQRVAGHTSALAEAQRWCARNSNFL